MLIGYVSNSEPINSILRKGLYIPEIDILDGLFTKGEVPHFLYRLLPNDNIIIDENGTIIDSAYLSCSGNFDDFIDNVGPTKHLACLRIESVSPIERINVRELLPDFNDEGEIILSRNLVLNVIGIDNYDGIDQFEVFLKKVDCDSTSPLELYKVMGIEKITLYSLKV